MLEATVAGRIVRAVRLSGLALREPIPRTLPRRLAGRRIEGLRRHGKYLIFDFDGGRSLLSHLGMSGRWLYQEAAKSRVSRHAHARFSFVDGTELCYEDPRRFGLLRVVATAGLARDRALEALGPDPIAHPPEGEALRSLALRLRLSVKDFLLDQRRIAGIGNIYASEILHRAALDPRRAAGTLDSAEWRAIAAEIPRVLGEAIDRMGTTFSMYRTLWGEPGSFAERLRVYDRAGEPCGACSTPIRRIVQGQRSTFYCPRCQSRAARRRESATSRG